MLLYAQHIHQATRSSVKRKVPTNEKRSNKGKKKEEKWNKIKYKNTER